MVSHPSVAGLYQCLIIRRDGLDYHINLGKTNGLKVGDRFRILHKADFTDVNGQEHALT